MNQVYAVLNVFLQIFKVKIAGEGCKGVLCISRPIGNFKMHSRVPCKSFCQANGAGNSCPFISFAYQKYRRRRRRRRQGHRQRLPSSHSHLYAAACCYSCPIEIYAKFSYWAQGHTRKFSKLHLASKIAASLYACVCVSLPLPACWRARACVCSWGCLFA